MENRIINKYITIEKEILLHLSTIEQNDIRYGKLSEKLARIDKQINTYNSIIKAINRKFQLKNKNKSTYQLEKVGINKLIRKLEKELDPILLNELKTMYKTMYNIDNLTDEFDPNVVFLLNSKGYTEYKRNNELLDRKYFSKEKTEEELVIDANAFIEKFNANNKKTNINDFFKQEVAEDNTKNNLSLAIGQKHNITKPILVKESKIMKKRLLDCSYKLVYVGISLMAISMAPFINNFAISALLAMSSFPILGTGILLKNKDKLDKYKKYNFEIDKLYGLYNLETANLKLYEEITNLINLIENDKKIMHHHKKQLLSKIKKLAKKVKVETREEKEEFERLNNIYNKVIEQINTNDQFYISVNTIKNYYELIDDSICLTDAEKVILFEKVNFIAKYFNYNPSSIKILEEFKDLIGEVSKNIDWYITSKTEMTKEDANSILYQIEGLNKKISFDKILPLQEKLLLINKLAKLNAFTNNSLNNTRVEGRKIG